MRELLKVLMRDPLSIQITNDISKSYHIKLTHAFISYPFHSTSTINHYLKQLIIFIFYAFMEELYHYPCKMLSEESTKICSKKCTKYFLRMISD